jgi:hypothetical protein
VKIYAVKKPTFGEVAFVDEAGDDMRVVCITEQAICIKLMCGNGGNY